MSTVFKATADRTGIYVAADCGWSYATSILDHGVNFGVHQLIEMHEKHLYNKTKPCKQCQKEFAPPAEERPLDASDITDEMAALMFIGRFDRRKTN